MRTKRTHDADVVDEIVNTTIADKSGNLGRSCSDGLAVGHLKLDDVQGTLGRVLECLECGSI